MSGSWELVHFPIVSDRRGNLTFIEGSRTIPFDINRVYYLYDVPGGAHRGGHAHKELHQVVIAVSGSFDIHLNDGRRQQTVTLNRSYYGLYMRNMVWRELHNFSSGACCLVLASRHYDEADYIRDFDEFLFKATGERPE
ncbi:MAG: WxcM-like domain-containing protein [Niveispirillum sp.]|uniref:sugar 3,4-ketoisomerase n=1 Tax=Asticcacaulis sp. TaxID=1872648 RepID=UPI001A2E26D9|nr:FdtA/QdtA family cupin domain-containing protein [Asticcacaulis sp.]MBJ7414018.1 WxcM-like domain-containing protein [Niveispirillum sp.]